MKKVYLRKINNQHFANDCVQASSGKCLVVFNFKYDDYHTIAS